MQALYQIAGTTRQAHHLLARSRAAQSDRLAHLHELLLSERCKHPSMGLKKLYHRLKPDFIGRDAFIDYGMENGLGPVFAYKKPSLSRPSTLKPYSNLVGDLRLFDINQIWVSDITYLKVNQKWCYLTFIEDVYSRQIIGYCAAENLYAIANINALEMALKHRKISKFNYQLIHHSDRGSQYLSNDYVQKLNDYEIKISLAYSCFDNAHMESANNIIKNEYLVHRPIKSFQDLCRFVRQDVWFYNNERPHGSLNRMTPVEFERYILNIPIFQRTPLTIFSDKSKKNNLLIVGPDNQQLTFNFPRF